jgi:hypothetical protein
MVSSAHPDLWTLALDYQQIGPPELIDAIEREVGRPPLDFRTRLLIRDSLNALAEAWGKDQLSQWLSGSPRRIDLEEIRNEPLGPPGFPTLALRIMEPTRINTVIQFLRELSQSIKEPTTIAIGGSVALILAELLSRKTDDIDLVDEVPVQIRLQHELLDRLAVRYALRLTHFQSHYLPTGWESRLHRFDEFGQLEISLVDSGDIFLSKVFSAREKDLDDLRALAPQIDNQMLTQRLLVSAVSLANEPALRQNAEKNWFIVFGKPLPR